MKKAAIFLVFLALVASGLIGYYLSGSFDLSSGDGPATINIGQKAPDFTLKDKAGKIYSLSSLRGKVVLVNFWATWCPPCRSEIPSMDEMYKNYSRNGKLELLAVNIEPEGEEIIEEFSQEFPHSFPVVFDRDAAVQNLYGVYKFPETFIIDKNGIIVERVVGGIDWTAPDVLTYLNSLIRE